MTERLYRHPTDRVIAGVAGGLAVWLNIDPSLVRIAWVLLAIFTGGAFVLVYIVMMIVVPLPPAGWIPRRRDAGWGGPSGGWSQPGSSATWGPTAAPDASRPASGWGEAPQGGWGTAQGGGWGQPATPAWGDPATPAAGTGTGAHAGAGAAPGASAGSGDGPGWGTGSGYVSGWGTNTAPTQGTWTAQKAGNAGIVAGVFLVALGVWFLVDQYVSIDWDLLWPVAIMVLGGMLIAGALVRGRST